MVGWGLEGGGVGVMDSRRRETAEEKGVCGDAGRAVVSWWDYFTLLNRFAWPEVQDRDPTEGAGSSEVSCRWMHMHTVQYKHGVWWSQRQAV